MINNSNELGCSNKEEGNASNNKQPTNFYSTWSGLKNPRIVRVSRAFGGKDRHSKVTTVRGLRDRRVRLSVQTAIQLYDLQDKLGFNQPSKVVDWLINAAQHEIDKLPPLQVPPGSLFPFPQFINPSSNISDTINRVQERYLQSNTVNTAMVKETSVGSSLDWNSREAMKQMANGDQASSSKTNLEENQSFIMPNNSISQTPYNYQDSMNAYMHYLGNHSSQGVAYNPIHSESTNFDWKYYNHFYTSTLPNISQRNQAFKKQRTQDEELGN